MKQFWISLPVKNVNRSKDFFTRLGFKFNEQHGAGPNAACMLLGEKEVVVMLFDESTFKGFINNGAVAKDTEVLFSIDAQSKEEVDAIALKAVEAGGTSNHRPSELKGFMYGCIFSDPDGHRWNVLYMDMNKIPKR